MTSSRKTITTNFGKGKRGKKTFLIAGASVNLSITHRNLYEDSAQKQKIESSNDSGNHSLVYTQMTQHASLWGMSTMYRGTQQRSTGLICSMMWSALVALCKWMNNKNMTHIHTELCSATKKNEIVSFTVSTLNLDW